MEEKKDVDVIAILRDHGLQVTYQRLAIYQALNNSKEHPSVEVIYQQVKKRFPMISLGTVYKTLEKFHVKGLIKKVNPVNEISRYEAETELHHHLICEKCQSIHDIYELSGPIPFPEKPGFQITSHQVIFHGCCENCANK
jgi:Fe2+ or Zn2+ uptake regulation protein